MFRFALKLRLKVTAKPFIYMYSHISYLVTFQP